MYNREKLQNFSKYIKMYYNFFIKTYVKMNSQTQMYVYLQKKKYMCVDQIFDAYK